MILIALISNLFCTQLSSVVCLTTCLIISSFHMILDSLFFFFFIQCYTLWGWPLPTNNSQLSLMHVWPTYSLNGDTPYAMFSRREDIVIHAWCCLQCFFFHYQRCCYHLFFLSCLISIMSFQFLGTLVCGDCPCNLFVQ